eukprot:symbB.v1.2.041045.t1/scaffold7773.1/size9362/1
MAPERLCLGCGLRAEEKFIPIFPGERGPLFAASVKELQFALRASSALASAKGFTEEEGAPLQAIRPKVTNRDCHFLAVLVQSVLEGRTDCPISGLFGAGKTRAAAAMIAGLLVMDPTLKVMVVTKENAAAHAFAKHIESLQLPPSLEEKFGRLVGVTELEKGPASKTKLDVLPGFRNTVLRTKQVIIGCGGGFHQECTQPYSPAARWMSEVDVALNDEGQQYGNLDEASAIARVPRKGLVVKCGDHKQTPGRLRKSYEARAFRRNLMRRPIALRGDTKFTPPHMLGAIVHPYVQDVPGLQVAGLRQLLHESTRQPLELSTGGVAAFQEQKPVKANQVYDWEFNDRMSVASENGWTLGFVVVFRSSIQDMDLGDIGQPAQEINIWEIVWLPMMMAMGVICRSSMLEQKMPTQF